VLYSQKVLRKCYIFVKARFWVMSKKHTTKKEFQDANKGKIFIFKQGKIEDLPYVADGIIDLYDSTTNSPGFSLILRLTHNAKTFYVKTKRCKTVSFNSMRKIGVFAARPNGNKIKKAFVGITDARAIFDKKVKELSILSTEAQKVSEMTIREYIETMYTEDRATSLLKNGKCKPVTEKTKKEILNDFALWIDKKINEATKEWPKDFKKHWLSITRIDEETNEKVCTTITGTMRKKYGMINAVFNMCETKGYIIKNPLDGQVALFPESKNRSRIEYNYVFEEAIDFIFGDDINSSLAGKLIVATMILTGSRNSEVFKNYRKNFNKETGVIFIPAHISKNGAERKVMIDNETYWKYFNLYLKIEYSKNKYGHMFPSTRIDSHVSPEVYRKVWPAVKLRFDIEEGRLYDTRHTFAKKFNRKHGISETADVIGDSIQTAHEHYVKGDETQKLGKMASIQQKGTEKKSESIQEKPTTEHSQQVITVNENILPDPLKPLFTAFKNGKAVPAEGQLFAEQWTKFVNFITKKHERSSLGEDVEDWLLMQE
jgi:integrase